MNSNRISTQKHTLHTHTRPLNLMLTPIAKKNNRNKSKILLYSVNVLAWSILQCLDVCRGVAVLELATPIRIYSSFFWVHVFGISIENYLQKPFRGLRQLFFEGGSINCCCLTFFFVCIKDGKKSMNAHTRIALIPKYI